ncbi:MAG: hypothetical protein ACPG5P_00615, partial [Saprospiraceae bacterium]
MDAPGNPSARKRKRTPIISEAFRFLHISKPDIYSGETMDYNFIPAYTKGKALGIKGKADSKGGFSPIRNLSEVREVNETLFVLSFWLGKNRRTLTKQSGAKRIKGLKPLSSANRTLLWENLFHQALRNESSSVRDAIIRMIQADNFIRKFPEATKGTKESPAIDRALRNIAGASVIIPNRLFDKPSKKNASKKAAMAMELDRLSNELLTNKLEHDLSVHHIHILGNIISEIEDLEKKCQTDNRAAYQVAYAKYLKELKELEDMAGKEISNGSGTVKICDTNVKEFSFVPKNPMEDDYLQENLTKTTYSLLREMKSEGMDSLSEVRKDLDKKRGERFRKVAEHSAPPRKTIMYQGISIPMRSHPLVGAVTFRAVPHIKKKGYFSFYLTQFHKDRENIITGFSTKSKEIPFEIVSDSGHYTTFRLFPEGIPLKDGEVFTLNGNVGSDKPKSNVRAKAADDSVNLGSYEKSQYLPATTIIDFSDIFDGVPGTPKTPIYGVTNLGVGEFKRVEQELCCYVEGEVSHIDNIMAREYKERSTRSLTRSEITTERTSEREVEDVRDTTSTDRNEVQSEVSKVLQEDESRDFGVNASVSANWGWGSFNAGTNFNTSSSSSSSSNFSESASYAKELTERAMKRIVEKVTDKRTSKMIREFEETNKHGFDNREGENHVTGIYRWIDKIYENRLMNYGKRLMYEFMVPEPSRNFKHLLFGNTTTQVETCDTKVMEEPKHPSHFGINSYWNIEWWNYPTLASEYGVDIEAPLDKEITINKAISENVNLTGAQFKHYAWDGAYSHELEIPEGYECIAVHCRHQAYWHADPGPDPIRASILIGNRYVSVTDVSIHINGFSVNDSTFTALEGILPISIRTREVGTISINIIAKCRRKAETYTKWRSATYMAIMQAYNERMAEYREMVNAQCVNDNNNSTEDSVDYNINPILARSIEKRELKRVAIGMMLRPFGRWQGRNNYYDVNPANNYHVDQNAAFASHARIVKFFEEAIDWEIMAYELYPYSWAGEDQWKGLLGTTSKSDMIFQSFLQSGMAKMVVPVRAGYEKSMMFYLDTGVIWDGDWFVTDGMDGLYQSVSDELQIELNDEGYPVDEKDNVIIEAKWKTRIPTSLTVIQKYSGTLDDDGLPCACDEKKTIADTKDGEHHILGVVLDDGESKE